MALTRDFTDMIVDRATGTKLSDTLASLPNIGIQGRTSIFVESYDYLKVALASDYDYSPCIQKAFDDAALNGSVVTFPTGKVLLVTQPIRLKGQNGNYVFMNRCVLKRTGVTSTTDSPIMYYSSLTTIGGVDKSYNYNSGVFIFDGKFMGEGYGVGYKHAIAGELYLNNCVFDSTLETGVALSGTNGCHFFGCQITGNKKGIFCARVAEDSYTANYTLEGTGWNDGIYVVGGMITAPSNGYGLYYSGTTSEGVIKLSNVKMLGGTNSVGAYARSFTNFVIDGGWAEYFNGGKVFFADSDSTAAGYESDSFVVKNFQFTNHGGTNVSISDYSIYAKATRVNIEDCVFLGSPNIQHIYYSSGSPSALRIAFSAQPTAIDTSFGTITLPKTNLIDTRDLTITDGTNSYYLVFNADMGATGYKYNTYTYVANSRTRPREWRYGTYIDDYTITRITNPVLSLSTTYTINSTDDTTGYCEIQRPIFQAVSGRSKMVGYGGFGVILVKNPMMR
jgi:hypothetical protein